MTREELRARIKDILTEQEVEVFGYCSAKPFPELEQEYLCRQEEGTACSFEKRTHLSHLTDPQQCLENAASFLVVLLPHAPYKTKSRKGHGRMSTGTASMDYHKAVEEKLSPVSDFLRSVGIENRIICDTSPLSDRAIAVRSGLGTVRRNNMLYHSKYGSYHHIGSILMTETLHDKDHKRILDPCGHCRRCVAACPGNAIQGDGTINSNRCISWLTQKKELTQDECVILGRMIYGCDICQKICPINRKVANPALPLLVPEEVSLEGLLSISNRQFNESFKRTSAGWRGKRTLQRNALAILGNIGGHGDRAMIERFLEDPRPIIRNEAERSMTRLNARIKGI